MPQSAILGLSIANKPSCMSPQRPTAIVIINKALCLPFRYCSSLQGYVLEHTAAEPAIPCRKAPLKGAI